MRIEKGSFMTGYVEIVVIGEYPERFLQKCTTNGIVLWDIKKAKDHECTAMAQLKDVKKIKKLRHRTHYKIRFKSRYGIPFMNKRLAKKKPLIFGLFLSVLLFVVLSNMIWQVTVEGVPEELENQIREQLTSYGIFPGAFTFMMESPNQIQQSLLEDIPELLWIGVDKKGTSMHLEGVEKLIIKEEESKSPSHLIAGKNGVIKNMYVKTGLPQVNVNDFVEKGTVLVSGAIEKPHNEDEDDAEFEYVAAEGEVIAVTWYRVDVVVSLEAEHIELTGNMEENYRLRIGSLSIPLWPWKSEGFANEMSEVEENQLKIFGWELPIYFIKENKMESILEFSDRSREEAVEVGINQAKSDLLRTLGPEAEIITEKVLQQTLERGKVILSLYFAVEENIAVEQPLN